MGWRAADAPSNRYRKATTGSKLACSLGIDACNAVLAAVRGAGSLVVVVVAVGLLAVLLVLLTCGPVLPALTVVCSANATPH